MKNKYQPIILILLICYNCASRTNNQTTAQIEPVKTTKSENMIKTSTDIKVRTEEKKNIKIFIPVYESKCIPEESQKNATFCQDENQKTENNINIKQNQLSKNSFNIQDKTLQPRQLNNEEIEKINEYRKSICNLPEDNPEIMYKMARIYYEANNFEQAATLFRYIAINHSNDSELARYSADLYLDCINIIPRFYPYNRCECSKEMSESVEQFISDQNLMKVTDFAERMKKIQSVIKSSNNCQ